MHRIEGHHFASPFAHHFAFRGKQWIHTDRERKMRTNLFLHKLFEHLQGSGTSGKIPVTSPDSSLRNSRKTNFWGSARTFRPAPLRREDPPSAPGSQKKVSGLKKLIFVLFLLLPEQKILWKEKSEPPIWGRRRRGSPRFVPISSDLVRFALPVFGNAPISSDLFRFLPICFQNKPERIRETPFCRPPFANPRKKKTFPQKGGFSGNGKGSHWFEALRKGPPFHGSRSSREIKIQNASCQMGSPEVARW